MGFGVGCYANCCPTPPPPLECISWPSSQQNLIYNVLLDCEVGSFNAPERWNYLTPDYGERYVPAKTKIVPPDGNGPLGQCGLYEVNDPTGCRTFDTSQGLSIYGTYEFKTGWTFGGGGPSFIASSGISNEQIGGFGARQNVTFNHTRSWTKWGWRHDSNPPAPTNKSWWDLMADCTEIAQGRRPIQLIMDVTYSVLVSIKQIGFGSSCAPIPSAGSIDYTAEIQVVHGGSEEDVARMILAGNPGGDTIGGIVTNSVSWPAILVFGTCHSYGFAINNATFSVDVTGLLQNAPAQVPLYWAAKMFPAFCPLSLEIQFYPNRTDVAGLCGTTHKYNYVSSGQLRNVF